jgi:hypothetical protein
MAKLGIPVWERASTLLCKVDPGYIDPDMTEKDALAETKKLWASISESQ